MYDMKNLAKFNRLGELAPAALPSLRRLRRGRIRRRRDPAQVQGADGRRRGPHDPMPLLHRDPRQESQEGGRDRTRARRNHPRRRRPPRRRRHDPRHPHPRMTGSAAAIRPAKCGCPISSAFTPFSTVAAAMPIDKKSGGDFSPPLRAFRLSSASAYFLPWPPKLKLQELWHEPLLARRRVAAARAVAGRRVRSSCCSTRAGSSSSSCRSG